ncbi:hypothetical protein CSC28_1989 [Pseudomonas paraeruginosa]|nr:hypothetical protein CSC28_1989 [Pseudomonas paraeruginosa]
MRYRPLGNTKALGQDRLGDTHVPHSFFCRFNPSVHEAKVRSVIDSSTHAS